MEPRAKKEKRHPMKSKRNRGKSNVWYKEYLFNDLRRTRVLIKRNKRRRVSARTEEGVKRRSSGSVLG